MKKKTLEERIADLQKENDELQKLISSEPKGVELSKKWVAERQVYLDDIEFLLSLMPEDVEPLARQYLSGDSCLHDITMAKTDGNHFYCYDCSSDNNQNLSDISIGQALDFIGVLCPKCNSALTDKGWIRLWSSLREKGKVQK